MESISLNRFYNTRGVLTVTVRRDDIGPTSTRSSLHKIIDGEQVLKIDVQVPLVHRKPRFAALSELRINKFFCKTSDISISIALKNGFQSYDSDAAINSTNSDNSFKDLFIWSRTVLETG